MAALVLALVVLALIGLGFYFYLRISPATLARLLRPVLVLAGAVGIGSLLIFGVRFLPSLLPELFALLGIVGAVLIVRHLRRRQGGGFSAPAAGQRTEVRTAFVEAWIDHATGDVGGRVVKGRFAGRGLDALGDGDLPELHAECAGDADSRRVLEAYLDRRLGPDWRKAQAPPRGPRTDITRDEALAILGLASGATVDEIRAAHRRLILRVHPDAGGSADLAARINRAKDVLLG